MKIAPIALSLAVVGAVPPSIRNTHLPRIVGGSNVPSASKYPFVAYLENGGYSCGATILSPTKVVTAAHCVDFNAVANLTLRAGSLRFDQGGTVVGVSQRAIHPKWRSTSIYADYDVAVLTLATPLPFSATVAAATLPPAGQRPTAGQLATALGWGSVTAQKKRYPGSPQLREVNVHVAACRDPGAVSDRQFCAGDAGRGTCAGDSGGPLFDPSARVLRGGTSGGLGCGRADAPAIFADYAHPALNGFIQARL